MLIRETRGINGRPPVKFVECIEERCDKFPDPCANDGQIEVMNRFFDWEKDPVLEIENPPALLRRGVLQPVYTFLLEEFVWLKGTYLTFRLQDNWPDVRVIMRWEKRGPDHPSWITTIEAWDWVSVEQIRSGKPLAGRILECYSLALKDHDAQLLAKNHPSFVHSLVI